ncbi:hypothetical protein [Leucobacter sp. USHLN153]|uniref:hypothetical protein n=1 Tax=Leucobacter sp. USHLN153 TaxID=3081268 RepID=UPI00301B56EA
MTTEHDPVTEGRTTPETADRTAPSDPAQPTATSPDSVPESVPEAEQKVGQTGPDAADPPNAGADSPLDSTNGLKDSDAELDPDEGADAFETDRQADDNAREEGADRDENLPHISVDTPD